MSWKRMLAYVTGSVDEELLLRNEYLAAENRILRSQVKCRLRLTDPERKSLAEIGKKLGKKALEEIASIVKPDTILSWHRRLIARKFDGSKNRSKPGRPRTKEEIENLVVQVARENKSWGFDRIQGALANLGIRISDQTIGNILRRNDIPPAPERKRTTTWKEFIAAHMEVLFATDFFTAEVWTKMGLTTYYVLFFMRIGSREVHIAGTTIHPNESWMKQIARNLTMEDWGFLQGCRYLIHDNDSKFCESFRAILGSVGIKCVALPARSPNLNSYAERWVRSVKEECLRKMILFGEASLHRSINQFIAHYHTERNHQGKGNRILTPSSDDRIGASKGEIQRRKRLGGLLNFYHRRAA